MTTPWRQRYAQRTGHMRSSAIRELLKLTQDSEVISFAGGLPAPELFPIEEFRVATDRVLSQHGYQALQYSTTNGYLPLREFIVQKMARYGIQASPDNILLTSGSQQALDLIGKILINPGDRVLTEEPTFLGALQAWNAYQAEYITIPVDDDGLKIERLEQALCAGPKFMYILPNFQNPSGVTLSLSRRQELVETADRYGIPIIEDDPYGELRYDGNHQPPLVVLDADKLSQRCRSAGDVVHSERYFKGNVIYLSTFSKTLAPGLRLGWLVAPADAIELLILAKQGVDLHTSTFIQMVVYEIVKDGFLDEHVRRIRQVYQRRRDAMLNALERHFPPGIRWTSPEGGLFLWVTFPLQMNAADLLEKAIANQVAFVPGSAFYANVGGHNMARFNFSNASSKDIEIGISRLATMLEEEMEELGDLSLALA